VYIPEIKLLLDSGADTEIGDKWGETPIFHTQALRGTEALSLLMAKNATIDAKDKFGKTALKVAICNNDSEWEKHLAAYGASYEIVKDSKCEDNKDNEWLKEVSLANEEGEG